MPTVKKNYDHPPTLNEALADSEVDPALWRVERYVINRWEMGRKGETKELSFDSGRVTGTISDSGGLTKKWMYQIKVTLVPKTPVEQTLTDMLEKLATGRPAVAKIKRPKIEKVSEKNMLEISVMDLHLGMLSYASGNVQWDIESASEAFLGAIARIIKLSKPHKVEKILFPIGNDYLHSEHTYTTTKGTLQQEAVDVSHTFAAGKDLLVAAIELMKKTAPVHVISVPGNHAHNAEIHMSHVIHAWFRNDPNVEVEFGDEPYRFVHYGVNLIGFEHGNNIKPSRLQQLMPSAVPDLWAKTRFRDWHLGDRHRKGSAQITSFEEFGVGVEYLPSLVPTNTWHRENAFSHQQRGAVGYLWNLELGPLARLHTHLL